MAHTALSLQELQMTSLLAIQLKGEVLLLLMVCQGIQITAPLLVQLQLMRHLIVNH